MQASVPDVDDLGSMPARVTRSAGRRSDPDSQPAKAAFGGAFTPDYGGGPAPQSNICKSRSRTSDVLRRCDKCISTGWQDNPVIGKD